MELPKRYDPQAVESKWYKFWLERGYFTAVPSSGRTPFTIVIPPPNVTDVLHLGHALNTTIQDIYIRYRRMQGYVAEWLPGVDHAGIATQVVVEREVLKYESLEKIGRANFLSLIWDWATSKKNTILEQLKSLGCSCDWTRTKFTLDPELSDAVYEAFVRLYKKGLIYRGAYIVNWCTRCKTAISDDEVEYEEEDGKLYYIKYPLKNQEVSIKNRVASIDKQSCITVATTRPETMLGDTACAVNPKDKKNAKFIGRTAILPLIIGRELPIIADERVDPEFGTGVVKITPAHDPVDFDIAETHTLPRVIIMDESGIINSNGGKYKGLDRWTAREKIISDLKSLGLFEREEPYRYSVGHCYRCRTIIEPLLSTQWFVKMKTLAEPAIRAVETGEIKFHPERWRGVYLNWMYNIKDWCISRQIWWGHRLPVYYCKQEEIRNPKSEIQNMACGEVIVAKEKPSQCPKCGNKNLVQDTDVLDTWFSSWLWPFSTFGWPKNTAELEYFYPTSVLSTAPEIIFFWVARMIMAGYEFTCKPPFRDVYIHGTVRDANGVRMSKSLGNGIDPRDVIKSYGTDALRFSLITASGEGQDPHIQPNTFDFGRSFANKLWNAHRLLILLPKCSDDLLTLADRWILSRQYRLVKDVTQLLDRFKLQEPAMRIYDFFWHEFCDWYIEIIKISGNKKVGLQVLETILKLLHPFIPFITEEIWHRLRDTEGISGDSESIMVSKWPVPCESDLDLQSENEFGLIKSIITSIRAIRNEKNVPRAKFLKLLMRCSSVQETVLKDNSQVIKSLAKVETIEFTAHSPKHSHRVIVGDVEIFIPLEGFIELGSSLANLERERKAVEGLLKSVQARLSSPDFIKKAPKDVVKRDKERLRLYQEKLSKLSSNIKLIQDELSN